MSPVHQGGPQPWSAEPAGTHSPVRHRRQRRLSRNPSASFKDPSGCQEQVVNGRIGCVARLNLSRVQTAEPEPLGHAIRLDRLVEEDRNACDSQYLDIPVDGSDRALQFAGQVFRPPSPVARDETGDPDQPCELRTLTAASVRVSSLPGHPAGFPNMICSGHHYLAG